MIDSIGTADVTLLKGYKIKQRRGFRSPTADEFGDASVLRILSISFRAEREGLLPSKQKRKRSENVAGLG
jgi:hypothetical protein